MVDPAGPSPPERWLHVVRDGEPPPGRRPADGPAGDRRGTAGAVTELPGGDRLATDQPGGPATSAARPPDPQPGPDPGVLRRVALVLTVVAVGTATAAAVDALAGGLDGAPAAHLLVLLALPFWDRLPARLPHRLGALGLVTAAVAAAWFVLAAFRPEPWWRAQVAFGLACAVVGTAATLLSRRRTVVR